MSEKLKPCPFCGAVPEYYERIGRYIRVYYIKCQCGAIMTRKSRGDTIEAWNRRANDGKID